MDIIFQSYIERILRLLYQYLLYDQTFVYFSIPSRQMNECWIFIAHIPYHFSPPATYINSSNAFKYFPRQSFLKDRGITETFTSALRYQHTIIGNSHQLQNHLKNPTCSPGSCTQKIAKGEVGVRQS